MVQEFENSASVDNCNHYEQTPAIQREFCKDVMSVISSFEVLGNPFTEESQDLFAIHAKDVMDGCVVEKNVVNLGEDQYRSFVKERFVERSKAVTEP